MGAGEDAPPKSISVVVFGSWPKDTERSRIVDDIEVMLDLHGYDYKDIYTPAPRHTIGKVRFRTPAEAWRLLDNKFRWPDRWMTIERTRHENKQRRPLHVIGRATTSVPGTRRPARESPRETV